VAHKDINAVYAKKHILQSRQNIFIRKKREQPQLRFMMKTAAVEHSGGF
jgi:hypothetical protein